MERMIFGAALTDPCAFQQIADVLWAGDFSLEKHQRIFLRATEVHGRGEEVNYVSVATELEKRGQLASIDGLIKVNYFSRSRTTIFPFFLERA